MKKYLLLIFPIVLIMGAANAQSDTCVQNSNLKREKFRLAFDVPNGSVLKKEKLQILLSKDLFKTYNHARRCYIASIPLLAGSACVTTASVILLGMDIFYYSHYNLNIGDGPYIIPSCALFGYAVLFGIIPGIVLITHSAKKLNRITEDYNNQRYISHYQRNIQLNFGFTQNGIGFKLNF